jgi:PHD/YefM family antitoxin component YafN of YafNO toxin-antitoxin module
MVTIHKKLVVDERGRPQEVIIPWDEYCEIEELLGLDLDAEAIADLEEAKRDREAGNEEAFLDIDSV